MREKQELGRREFVVMSAGLAAGLSAVTGFAQRKEQEATSSFKTKLYKALIVNRPTEKNLAQLKEAGFDGVEAGVVSPEEAEKSRKAAESLGMRIHSVLRGWAQFNSSDRARAEKSLATTEAALRAAQAYGADAVLLVPCRIGRMPMPRPWEFHIDFDDKTGHIRKVTCGDNSRYAEYIRAHNHATDTSREAVQRLIPLAEKTGVTIALENVWNNLWVKPAIFKQFVASFQSRWVRAYFDIGNHVKYARPEEWILSLADLLVKCHVKDFKLDPEGGGKFVNIRDGSVRWPVVRHALETAGYSGWMTIEGGNLSVEEHGKRLDLILAGQ